MHPLQNPPFSISTQNTTVRFKLFLPPIRSGILLVPVDLLFTKGFPALLYGQKTSLTLLSLRRGDGGGGGGGGGGL